ncbi:thioredoxin domain-containing protein [Chitinophaga sp. Mgbs1]|uniref:Thioredoxin domain-containing protein n=1 Tax=Chitinophaga solisilvae TaxID=1233460 RepID=A0A9Q5GW68_9BACT|nr:thioredoxin domain-containing protein [Chitinophaga solisilvae]
MNRFRRNYVYENMFHRILLHITIWLSITLSAQTQGIPWMRFGPEAFALAQQQHKPVLLDLGASWCHWCHVMDDSTYTHPDIIAFLSTNYICIRENQDKRPDLFARYKDYGWPATIIFHEDGRELVKEAGYFNPADFLALLQKTYSGYRYTPPEKKRQVTTPVKGGWSPRTAAYVRDNFFRYLDTINGGYDMQQRFLEYDGIAYALLHYKNNAILRKWLPLTIHNSYLINDSSWGGVYQYSTHGDWQHPHFEKIGTIQARYLKIYAAYYQETHDTTALHHAKKIISYLNTFLKSPTGLYYNSQDADLHPGEHAGEYFALSSADRYQQGIPLIDSSCYAKENAQLADAFFNIFEATGDNHYLQTATTILNQLIRYYKQPDGGYLHDTVFTGAIALADQLYTCQALLHGYRLTRHHSWQQEMVSIAHYILQHFTGKNNALYSFTGNRLIPPEYLLSENIDACHLLSRLSEETGNKQYKQAAAGIFRYLTSGAVLSGIIAEPGILMGE